MDFETNDVDHLEDHGPVRDDSLKGSKAPRDGIYDISVVVCTYNRSAMLPAALESVLGQEGSGLRFETIVVDNNSTDTTRGVVEGYMAQGHTDLQYRFEGRQGVSYARNAGIASARAQIIAFTDDDVRASRGWIANIKRVFDQHPEIDFLGGKILPRWSSQPPRWLTRDQWWALALLDCGDESFYVNADRPLCLPTANASFRRDVFRRFGLFSPEFSGREDHEFLLRLWRAGLRGMYVPTIVVEADVQPERLKKAYHRRWNMTTGKFNSLMRLDEILEPDGRITGEPKDVVTLFGVPAFIYRALLANSLRWLGATLRGRTAASLRHEHRVWYLIGYVGKRYEQNAARRRHSRLSELGIFMKALARKKLSRNER